MRDFAQDCLTAASGLKRSPMTKAILTEAADKITSQAAEIERLRAALNKIQAWTTENMGIIGRDSAAREIAQLCAELKVGK